MVSTVSMFTNALRTHSRLRVLTASHRLAEFRSFRCCSVTKCDGRLQPNPYLALQKLGSNSHLVVSTVSQELRATTPNVSVLVPQVSKNLLKQRNAAVMIRYY